MGLVLATPAAGAEIMFYEHPRFGGRLFTANQTIPNFASVGFNDRAGSVIIRSGSWQLCSDAYFRGRCVTLNRGEYPTLNELGLDYQVSSARELDWLDGPGGPGGGWRGRIELFENPNFTGQMYALNGPIANLAETGFNDKARSLVVHEGSWEACENANFGGTCQVFGPGRYANLGTLSGRISSLRAAGGPGHGGGGIPGAWGAGARAILYEGQNLSGRFFVINSEVASNLANTGFNDRAASLRVEGGYWVFCSDANFGGECQTFGPGDYSTLPWGLTYKISSGRRISTGYPYRENPNWQR
jgi:hypothetical protein